MNYDLLKGKLCWFWNKENDLHIDIFCDYYQDKEFPEQNTFYSLNVYDFQGYDLNLYNKNITNASMYIYKNQKVKR